MKTSTFFSLAFGVIAIGLTTVDIDQVKAATVTYNITVNNLDGSLSGNTFNGNFSFDDTGLVGSGSEFLSVFNLSFNFLGTTYTESDDNSLFGAEAVFLDGNFLGLSYSTDVEFSFVPGFSSINNSFFAYDFGSGDSGTGDIVYAIPEPLTILGSGTALLFGKFFKRKLSKKQNHN